MIPTSLTPTMREIMAMVIRYGEFSLDVVVAFLYWWLTSGKVKPYLEVKFVADNHSGKSLELLHWVKSVLRIYRLNNTSYEVNFVVLANIFLFCSLLLQHKQYMLPYDTSYPMNTLLGIKEGYPSSEGETQPWYVLRLFTVAFVSNLYYGATLRFSYAFGYWSVIYVVFRLVQMLFCGQNVMYTITPSCVLHAWC